MKRNICNFFRYQIFIVAILIIPFISCFANPKVGEFTTAPKGNMITDSEGKILTYKFGEAADQITYYYYLKTTAGTRLYCLTPGVNLIDGAEYVYEGKVTTGAACAIRDFVQHQNYYQKAIDWEHLGDEAYVLLQEYIWNKRDVQDTCDTHILYKTETLPVGSLIVEPESDLFSRDGDNYISAEISVSKTNLDEGEYDISISGATGAYAVEEKGGDPIETTKANSFYIVIPVSSVEGDMDITVTVSGEYITKKMYYNYPIIQKYKPKTGEGQLVAIIENANDTKIETQSIKQDFKLVFRPATLTIVKQDAETKQPIENVGFHLYEGENLAKTIDGNEVGLLYTNSEGKIVIENLHIGQYTLKEVSAAEGYLQEKKSFPIIIKNNVRNTIVEVTNAPVDAVLIAKRDSKTNELVTGAQMAILDSDGEKLKEFTTAEEIYSVYLNPGTYSIVEIEAPNGYQKLEGKIDFTISDLGKLDLTEETKENSYVELKDGQISIYNTLIPVIVKVPDTSRNMYIFMGIGGALLMAGSAITIVMLNRRKKIEDQI